MSMMTIWRGSTASPTTLDDAVLYNSLTHTAIPTRGSITPTFTRATTETGQKWDEAGYLDFTALAGEIVFKGARRERNLLATSSEDFSVTTGISLNATPTAGSVVFTNASAYRYKRSLAIPGTKVQCSCLVKSSDGSKAVVGVRGYGVASGASAFESVALTTEYQQITITISGATVNEAIDFGLENRVGNGGDGTATGTVEIAEIQINDITGETDQTTIRPYVSVGVESAPAYHGSMVDGVKCYATDRSGNPISTSGSYPIVGYVPWEARTNLALSSDDISNVTYWSVFETTVTADQAIGSDGAMSMDKVAETAVTQVHLFRTINIATTINTTYTCSIDLKEGTQRYATLLLWGATSSTNREIGTVDLQTGTISTPAGVPANLRMTPLANGGYRCSITGTTSGTDVNMNFYVYLSNNGANSPSYAGDTGKYIYAGKAQVELGSFATPRIPTTTVAVARNADVDQYPTTAGPIAAAGSISLDFTPYHAPSGTIALWGTYVDASNYTAILHDATNLIFRKRIAGVNYDATIANAFTSGTTYKMAASWGVGGSTIYLNGVAGTPHANTTAAQIAATMQFGANGNSLQQPGAAVIKNYIWQRQLSGSEQAAITA